jgi:hypothetical protein
VLRFVLQPEAHQMDSSSMGDCNHFNMCVLWYTTGIAPQHAKHALVSLSMTVVVCCLQDITVCATRARMLLFCLLSVSKVHLLLLLLTLLCLLLLTAERQGVTATAAGQHPAPGLG